MSLKKIIIKNLFNSTISSGINFTSKWFLNYALARFLTLESFGVLSFIMSATNLFKGFLSFGSQLFLIHKVAKDEQRKLFHLFKSIYLSVLIAIPFIIIILLLILFKAPILYLQHMPYALAIAIMVAFTDSIYAYFMGQGQFQKEAKGYIFFSVFVATYIACLYFNICEKTLTKVLVAIFLLNMAPLLFSIFQFYKSNKAELSQTKIQELKSDFKTFIGERLPYGFHELQSVLYLNAALILLGYLVPEAELAIFRAIQIVIVPISIFPGILSEVLLKQLSSHLDDKVKFKKIFRSFLALSSLMGIFPLVVFALWGEKIIAFLYAKKYESFHSVKLLIVVFSLTYFFRFISAIYGVLITSVGSQKMRVQATSFLIIITIASTIYFTKFMGIAGAALANAISYLSLLLIYAVYSEFKIIRKL